MNHNARHIYDNALAQMQEAAAMGARAKEQIGLARQLIVQELADEVPFEPSAREVAAKLDDAWHKLAAAKAPEPAFVPAGEYWTWRLEILSYQLAQLTLEPDGLDDAFTGIAFMERRAMPVGLVQIDIPEGEERAAFDHAIEHLILHQLSGEVIRPQVYETASVRDMYL